MSTARSSTSTCRSTAGSGPTRAPPGSPLPRRQRRPKLRTTWTAPRSMAQSSRWSSSLFRRREQAEERDPVPAGRPRPRILVDARGARLPGAGVRVGARCAAGVGVRDPQDVVLVATGHLLNLQRTRESLPQRSASFTSMTNLLLSRQSAEASIPESAAPSWSPGYGTSIRLGSRISSGVADKVHSPSKQNQPAKIPVSLAVHATKPRYHVVQELLSVASCFLLSPRSVLWICWWMVQR